MKCPQCHGPFDEPTTFPCGHSCCIEEAKLITKCCVCKLTVDAAEMKVNIFMREFAAKKYDTAPDLTYKNLLLLLECPICFVPFIDPTTFPCGHSVCLEEAKELRSCPICNSELPKILKVNVSMKEAMLRCSGVTSHLNTVFSSGLKLSADESNDVDKDDSDNEGAKESQSPSSKSRGSPSKKKSKGKGKKASTKKPIASGSHLADLYFKAKFMSDELAFDKLRVSESNITALSYFGVLLKDDSTPWFDKTKAIQIANRTSTLLEQGVYNEDKYCLFLAGMHAHTLSNPIRSLQLLKKSANLGYSVAQYWLGTVVSDPHKAVDWLARAAEQGIVMANYQLGLIYENKLKNFEEAVKCFKLSADQQHRPSFVQVGHCYFHAESTLADKSEGLAYYKMAAEKGDATAQYALGNIYLTGNGVSVDVAVGCKYLKQAVDANYSVAQYELGLRYYYGNGVEVNGTKGVRYIKMSADQGNMDAVKWFNKDRRFWDWSHELEFRADKAHADQGDATAQVHVAMAFNSDHSISVNYSEAFKYFKLSGDQGRDDSYVYLCEYYLYGRGVEQNESEGVRYCQLACHHGHYEAAAGLGAYYKNGAGGVVDYDKAFQYFKLAADNGNDQGLMNLGLCYRDGNGVERNSIEAARYLKGAVEKGNLKALRELKSLADREISAHKAIQNNV